MLVGLFHLLAQVDQLCDQTSAFVGRLLLTACEKLAETERLDLLKTLLPIGGHVEGPVKGGVERARFQEISAHFFIQKALESQIDR